MLNWNFYLHSRYHFFLLFCCFSTGWSSASQLPNKWDVSHIVCGKSFLHYVHVVKRIIFAFKYPSKRQKIYIVWLITSTWIFCVLAQPPYTMCLRVKFYPPDPAALKEEITRYCSLPLLFKFDIVKQSMGNSIRQVTESYNSLMYVWLTHWQFNMCSALFSDTLSSFRLKEICIMADSCAKVQMLLHWPHLFCRVTANHSHRSHSLQYLLNYGISRALLFEWHYSKTRLSKWHWFSFILSQIF